ncbi:MAG: HAD family hydrolase [Bacteroidales bacterium]|nr:HAD family hydrolase [Bacteroidales bacterium]
MIKLIIFDLDGTLLDTREDIADACNYALRMCGHPERDLTEYNMLVGRGIYNLFRGALPPESRSDESVLEMKSHFVPYYNSHICDKTKPYTGIIEMLDILAKEGITFAIASNKYQEGTEILVKKLLSRYGFIRILGQRDNKPIKPDPEIINEIMSAVPGIKAEEVIYCGDSDVDMQTGINAGIKTIGVTWGFRTREELRAYDPWLLAEKPEEISAAVVTYSE